MNKVELQGKVDRVKVLKVGEKSKTSFTVVIKKVYNNREFTDYVPVEAWKNLSLENGEEVRVEGSFTTQSWEGKDGNKLYKSIVNATRVYRVSQVLEDNDFQKIESEYSSQSNYKSNGNGGVRFEYNGEESPEDIF